MLISYTFESYNSKLEAQHNISKSHWLSYEGNHEDVIKLYNTGHIISLPQLDGNLDTYIIDCDHLTNNQIEDLNNPFFIMDLCDKLNVDSIEVLYSASRSKVRRKLFIKGNFVRNTVNNKDVNYIDFIENFNTITGIEVDVHQSTITQLTFGLKDKVEDVTYIISNSIKSLQPSKVNSVLVEQVPHSCVAIAPQELQSTSDVHLLSSISPMDNKCTSEVDHLNEHKEMITDEAKAKTVTAKAVRTIPVNQLELNNRYGKEQRLQGRLDWYYYHYTKEGKFINFIKEGYRDSLLGKLIKVTIYNALNCNTNYKEHFNTSNVERTIHCIINRQFENSKVFYNEIHHKLTHQIYNEWNRASKLSLEEYYKLICKEMNITEKYKYTPRDCSLLRLFYNNIHYFTTFTNREEVDNLIGTLCEGDIKSIKLMEHYYRIYVSNPLNKCKVSKYDELKNYNLEEFNDYCKDNNISKRMKYKLKKKYFNKEKDMPIKKELHEITKEIQQSCPVIDVQANNTPNTIITINEPKDVSNEPILTDKVTQELEELNKFEEGSKEWCDALSK